LTAFLDMAMFARMQSGLKKFYASAAISDSEWCIIVCESELSGNNVEADCCVAVRYCYWRRKRHCISSPRDEHDSSRHLCPLKIKTFVFLVLHKLLGGLLW